MKYKITISEITETEVPKTEYENTHKKDNDGKEIWGYAKTGGTEIQKDENEVYIQEVEGLDIGELAVFINRTK